MFPGASADVDEAAYVIIGAPLDRTTTFRPGTRFGPERIRRYSRHFDDFDHVTGQRFTDLAVGDDGDIPAGDDVSAYLNFLESTIRGHVYRDAMPVILGGEHTVSVAGVRATKPSTFVSIDAHLDLRDTYDENPLNHATTTRRILETVDRVVIIGARTGDEVEWDRADQPDVEVVPPNEAAAWTPTVDEPIYLSVDIDGADPSVAPGTGTPEPFGLSGSDMQRVVAACAPKAIGFDVVEVNDHDDGQAATLAGKLVRRFVYAHAAARQ